MRLQRSNSIIITSYEAHSHKYGLSREPHLGMRCSRCKSTMHRSHDGMVWDTRRGVGVPANLLRRSFYPATPGEGTGKCGRALAVGVLSARVSAVLLATGGGVLQVLPFYDKYPGMSGEGTASGKRTRLHEES